MPEIVTRHQTRVVPPVFIMYSLEEIARASGYTLIYVTDMFSRPDRISRAFRSRVSDGLGRPSAELFEHWGLEEIKGHPKV